MHGPPILALILAAAASADEPVEPSPPVHIDISGNPSFSAEELARALVPRLPPEALAGTLSVSVRPDGLVELAWQSRKRVVDLRGESGVAAARVAALLAADLLPVPVPAAPPTPPVVALPAPPAREPTDFISLGVGYGLWSGGGNSPLDGVTMAAGLDRGYLRLRADVGWLGGATSPLLDMTVWPLRLGAGLGTTYVSLLGSLVVVPYQLAGAAQLTRTLVGGGLGLEGSFPIGAGFRLRVQAGFDRYVGKRLEVATGNVTFFESPPWAVCFGAALAWGKLR